MRVLIDTNVLFSTILFPNGAAAKSFLICAQNNSLVIPVYVINELKSVVKRKCPSKLSDVETFFQRLSFEQAPTPIGEIGNIPEIRDSNDVPILQVGIKENVDIILTGDQDFKDVKINHPRIMTPKEFLIQFQSKNNF